MSFCELIFVTLQSKNVTNMAKKILFINQEIIPYVPDSDLSIMGKALPQAMLENGHEIRTFMPKWGNINERRGQLHEVIRLSGMNLIIDDTDHPLIIKVASIAQTRIQVYFIDNDDYFAKRQMTIDENGVDYTDNGERAIFFARGVLETVKKLRWVPDIIHVQGWMGAVVPLYIKTAYHEEPSFANTKVVTSLFSKTLNSNLGENFKKSIEFREAKASSLKKYNDSKNILWGAVVLAFMFIGPSCLSMATRGTIQVSIAYSVWVSIGAAMVTIIGWLFYKDPIDRQTLAFLGMIIVGVVGLDLITGA